MGCGGSNAVEDNGVDRALAAEAEREAKKVKLLLLGAGESGKSTIFKQMKLIYGEVFSEEEKKKQLATVYMNTLQAMKILCEQTVVYRLEQEVVAQDSFSAIRAIDDTEEISVSIGDHVKALWEDPGIQMVWVRRNEYQIIEAVQYFFNKIDEIKMPTYVPSEIDIVHCRVRTAGIVTEVYNIDGTIFEMYDVGGQRNERKKWIHCFEGVTAVIFVAAISEFDQNLFEDVNTNRMTEALNLFDDICNNAFFTNSSMILFLNKRDLFETKIKLKNIKDVKDFNDFTGADGDYDAGVEYFVGKFLARNKAGASRQIYHHVTCATDTKNVKVVFDACKDIILRANLAASGFMD